MTLCGIGLSSGRHVIYPPRGETSGRARARASLAGALLIVGALAFSSPVRAESSAHAGPGRGSTPAPDADPAVSRSVAARSRMLECGHQWSSMKKAGTATGTWRDFSRDCLAQR